MGTRMNSKFLRMSIAAGVIVVALAGCSSSNSGGNFPPPGAAMANGKPTGPPPNVADCTVVSVGSPQKYVCNGKQYTSFDLERMREEYQKQQQSGQ
jgi:hypothetical protein